MRALVQFVEKYSANRQVAAEATFDEIGIRQDETRWPVVAQVTQSLIIKAEAKRRLPELDAEIQRLAAEQLAHYQKLQANIDDLRRRQGQATWAISAGESAEQFLRQNVLGPSVIAVPWFAVVVRGPL